MRDYRSGGAAIESREETVGHVFMRISLGLIADAEGDDRSAETRACFRAATCPAGITTGGCGRGFYIGDG